MSQKDCNKEKTTNNIVKNKLNKYETLKKKSSSNYIFLKLIKIYFVIIILFLLFEEFAKEGATTWIMKYPYVTMAILIITLLLTILKIVLDKSQKEINKEIENGIDEEILKTPVIDKKTNDNNNVGEKITEIELKSKYILPYMIIMSFIVTTLVVFMFYLLIFNVYDAISLILILQWLRKLLCITILLITILLLIMNKKEFKNLKCIFYKTKMEYIDDFFYRNRKVMKYDCIKSVNIRQNTFDKLFKIGTIEIVTNFDPKYR